jgi:DNA invertase Pin-like site-specific DNA recombinase
MEKLRVGYVRVSTLDQSNERQLVGLEGLGLDRVYSDKVSGSVAFVARPSGRRLLQDVDAGLVNEVHFWSVDRVGRDIRDITTVLHDLMERGVQVVIHKEGLKLLSPDGSQNPTATLVLSVMTAIAQIERQAIRERTAEGLAVARAKGRLIGRKKGTTETPEKFLAKPKSQLIRKYLESGHTVLETSKLAHCSTTTCVKVRKHLTA